MQNWVFRLGTKANFSYHLFASLTKIELDFTIGYITIFFEINQLSRNVSKLILTILGRQVLVGSE